ncbi:hypothetical protein K461DRAFT_279259 [Myriangium duriaei CBS 260.36]|uniref:Uncharacterized protein n=1 Tax=Myriangium duriaei CBS 260.36 TaxID=1168546 RepID=A0A9P4J0B5_9PEZI|nr:hypothetical protein K461DRAFT_279259 [Myriangium duriaei CBS 260.36]
MSLWLQVMFPLAKAFLGGTTEFKSYKTYSMVFVHSYVCGSDYGAHESPLFTRLFCVANRNGKNGRSRLKKPYLDNHFID